MATREEMEKGLKAIQDIAINTGIVVDRTDRMEKHLEKINGTIIEHGKKITELESSRKVKWNSNDIELRDGKDTMKYVKDALLELPKIQMSFKQFLTYSIALAAISLGGAYAVAQFVIL